MRSRTERSEEAEQRGGDRRRNRSAATALLSTAALVSSGLLAAAPAVATTPSGSPSTHSTARYKHLCARATRPGQVACLAVERTDVVQHMSLTPDTTPSGYGPSDLQSAYNLPSSTADAGQTVALIDAYDDPNAESDLATYRAQYGLPACTTANGCFRKVDEQGGTTYPAANSGWAGEISMDLDMVSAVCPQCHILLVEANSATLADTGPAVNKAVALGAKYISNSYGGPEDPGETAVDSQYFIHPGVVITASTGDQGYGVEYPAASRYVTAVGGTTLNRASNSRGWTETVWSDSSSDGTGSGCSADEPKTSWQTDSGCAMRTAADVSAVADPNTGLAVYDSYGSSGWGVYGGTSASSPIIAATYALAGTPAAGSYPASYPYAQPSALNDVTSGSNGTCSPSYLCTAGPGYDGPTGLGTPNGTAAFTSPSSTGDATTLQPGQQLLPGQSLVSAGMTLTMQTDGNLVAYLTTGGSGKGPALWASGTSGNPGAYASMQPDGNLVVYGSGGGPHSGGALWASGTYGNSGAYATLQDDGNLVVYRSGGGPSGGGALWATGTYRRSQTIGSGQQLRPGWWTQATYTRLVMQLDGNLVIYRNSDGKGIWSSGTYGHGYAYGYMQPDGNLVVYRSGGGPSSGGALWATGTYGHSGAYAITQGDGNFVVYRSGGGPSSGGALWATGTYQDVP